MSLALAGCGLGSLARTAGITFEPNPATLQAGVCASEARLIPSQSISSTLVTLVAIFPLADGETFEFRLNEQDLVAVADTIHVPAASTAILDLSFDLAAAGIPRPTEGSVVATGVGPSGSVTFVGTLACED